MAPEISNLRLALSGISGSISFSCWIVLLIPQLIEQWKLKSADGLSLATILIWFMGDVANLTGAIWAGLLPPVVLLALWFCFIDGSLIASYLYYKHIYPKTSARIEGEPLLATQRRASARKSSSRSRRDSLTSIVMEKSSPLKEYGIPVLFVTVSGFLGYLLSDSLGENNTPEQGDAPIQLGPQIFGYISASCYLGARIPQIILNHRRRSVTGLSLLFVIFSTLGNLSYSLQILFYRSDWDYIILNASWLIGSLGAIFEDGIMYAQFIIYSKIKGPDEAVEDV